MIARVAIALPIEAGVNGLPLCAMTVAPALRQRSASRISPVITTLSAPDCSAIQSSAASNPSDTTTRAIKGCTGTRSAMLATTVTRTAWRSATL